MEKKTLADTFLSINQLNRQKLNTLLKMMELEYQEKLDSKEYTEYVQIYELISSVLNKKISKVTLEEKEKIKEIIRELNPSLFSKITLEDLLQSNNRFFTLKRTLIDLDIPFLTLYHPKTGNPMQMMNPFFQLLGFNLLEGQKESTINEKLVNEYMVSDFMNVLYNTVQSISKLDTISKEEKKELLTLKYKLIFLSTDIETRALITKFSIPDYPYLVNTTTIETAGIKKEEYIDSLDDIIFNLIDSFTSNILKQKVEDNKIKNLYRLVILKTLVNLLNDKKICSCFNITYQKETNEQTKKMVDTVNKILEEAQEPKVEYQKQRKYFTV